MKLGIMPIVAQSSQRCLSLETSNKSKSRYQPNYKSQQLAFGDANLPDITQIFLLVSGVFLVGMSILKSIKPKK